MAVSATHYFDGDKDDVRTTADVLEALNDWPESKFRWGTADCCQLAGFIAYQLTGRDYLAAFNYNDELSAEEVVKTAGGLSEAVSRALGRSPVELDQLRPGDPVLFRYRGIDALCVNLGNGRAAGLTKDGKLTEISLKFCSHGWNI